jgi:predicted esterase
MMVALTTLHELGGVASLSGWIPRRARDVSGTNNYIVQFTYLTLKQMVHTQPNLPIFWGHGTADAEIPLVYAEEAMSFLRHALQVPICALHLHVYDGLAHSINDDELEDLASWLMHILA